MKKVVWVGLAGMLLTACAGADGGACAPREQQACVQSSGEQGFQVCDASGEFSTCTGYSPATTAPGVAPARGTSSADGTLGMTSNPASTPEQNVEGLAPTSPQRSGGAPDSNAALLTALQDRRFEFDSSQSDSNISRELHSELITCANGAFGLRQRDRSFIPGSGSLGGEDSYAGSWTLESASPGSVITLQVTEATTSVDGQLRFPVELRGGEIFIDDGTGFRSSSARSAATITDASADCATVAAPPGVGAPPSAEVPPTAGGASCPGLPAPADACDVCLAGACCSEAQACLPGTACGSVLACAQLCPQLDAACVQSRCEAGVEAGVTPLQSLVSCNNATCADSCGRIE